MSQDTEQFTKRHSSNDSQLPPLSSPKEAMAFENPFKHDSIPDIDPDRVARAKALLAKDGYPCELVLKSVAQHLANHWPAHDEGTHPPRS